MKFINKSGHTIYIPSETMYIPNKAIALLEKNIGFKFGLTPYKFKLQKKYNKAKED